MDYREDPDNPFNPGFGFRPPELAGRADIIAQFARAFTAGPRDPMFIAALIGDRGVGKTAVLDRIEEDVRNQNWAVVHEQAVELESLLAPLLTDLVSEASSHWTRLKKVLRGLDIEASLGFNAGVVSGGVKARSRDGAGAMMQVVRDVLRTVGQHAMDANSGVLITIDEAQSWTEVAELRSLAAALQVVVKREGLPVAVVFACLPLSREVLSAAGTFFERITYSAIDDLSKESTELALLKPAGKRGIVIDADALDVLVTGSGGYPYLIQLVGRHAWPALDAPRLISLDLAQRGVAMGRAALSELFAGRWENCSPMERAYLLAVARGGGRASAKEISALLGRTTEQLNPYRHSLIHDLYLLDAASYGKVSISLPDFTEWVTSQEDVEIPQYRPRH